MKTKKKYKKKIFSKKKNLKSLKFKKYNSSRKKYFYKLLKRDGGRIDENNILRPSDLQTFYFQQRAGWQRPMPTIPSPRYYVTESPRPTPRPTPHPPRRPPREEVLRTIPLPYPMMREPRRTRLPLPMQSHMPLRWTPPLSSQQRPVSRSLSYPQRYITSPWITNRNTLLNENLSDYVYNNNNNNRLFDR